MKIYKILTFAVIALKLSYCITGYYLVFYFEGNFWFWCEYLTEGQTIVFFGFVQY
jgi:hypothetical protein